MFMTPVLASAQTVQQSPEYQATLINLIGLLEQEVGLLQKELALQAQLPDNQQSTTTQSDSQQTQGTMGDMPELVCSLSFGAEGVVTTRNLDGTSTTTPNGTFPLSWSFPEGATGTLSSDNEDTGTLTESSGTRDVHTSGTVNYTLTVTQDGFQDAVCTATATHAEFL